MLKNVLSLLLSKFYSKKESGEVAHQALPSTNGTYLFSNKSVSNWGTVSTGVAPYDGFLVLNANGDGTSDSASIFVSTPCVKSMTTFPFPSAGCSTWAPIAKGEAWAVQGSNAKQISLELCKTIGGGYQTLKKLILQGGGLCCLKHSYSSLRRSSWLARSLGFTKIPSLLRTTLSPCFQVRQEFQTEATQRRLMEWPLSLLKKHRPKIFPVSWRSTVSGDNSSKTLNKVGKLIRLFTSLKATFFTWQQGAVIQRSVSSCSIPRPNLTVGGASC